MNLGNGTATVVARNLETGAVIAERVDVAASRVARAVGLLGRARLDPGEGLYIVPSRGVHTWGMRFAIDVAALDADGVVLDIAARMVPWRMRLPARGCHAVLELPAGTLAHTGTRVGHRIRLERAGNVGTGGRGDDGAGNKGTVGQGDRGTTDDGNGRVLARIVIDS